MNNTSDILQQDATHNAMLPTTASIQAWFCISMIVSIASSVLLVLLLITSFRRKELRTGGRILIINLTVTETLICAITVPILNITIYMGLIQESFTLSCSKTYSFHISALFSENWTTLLLSVNRLVAITKPHHYKKLLTRPVLIGMVVVPWLIGLGIMLPAYFEVGGRFILDDPSVKYCAVRGSSYSTTSAILGAYLPLVVIGLLYTGLLVRLVVGRFCAGRIQTVLNINASVVQSHLIRARQIALARILVTCFFWQCACCMLSPVLMAVYPHLHANFAMQFWLSKTVTLCGYAASPVIFLLLSEDYRSEIARLLRLS